MTETGEVLVTGAAGFIGSHLVERLLECGHRVVGLDNFDEFYAPGTKRRYLEAALEHPAFRLVEGDVRSQGVLDGVFADGPDLVVHLAALAGVRPSIREPLRYGDVNVGGTQRLLDWCRERGVGRFLFGSSSSVYGNNEKVPFAEDDPVDEPISPYAATKKAGELLCHTYHHLYDIGILCLRFFTVYGPRQRPDLAIHKFTRRMSRGEPIQQYGDGSSRRDYTYVEDILQGVEGAIGYLEAHPETYEVVNLGESETVELSRLIELLAEALGIEPEVEVLPPQPGDVERTWADVSKARRLFGYESTTGIEEGLERFVAWYREFHGEK